MKEYATAFEWDGKRNTVKKHMSIGNIKLHVRGIRLLDNALLIKNGNHTRTAHVGDIVVELPDLDWTYCKPDDFKRNWKDIGNKSNSK